MRYFDFIKEIKEISTSHILVNEYGEGDIYEYLNNGEHKYPCIFLTVTNLTTTDSGTAINFTLFYTDRLVENQANKTAIQSTGISVIKQILSKYEQLHPEYLLNNVNYTPFTEKFTDMCAGVFCDVVIENQIDTLENYDNGCEEGAFAVKTITLTKNGIYDIVGYDSAVVDVKPEIQKMKVRTLTVTNNCIINGRWNGEYMLDTSEMTIFSSMFNGCSSLQALDASNWDTSNVTSMDYMFSSCSSLQALDTSNWDTSNVTKMDYMFSNCNALQSIGDLSGWDTSNVTKMESMFLNCNALQTLDVSNWDTSNVTNMRFMLEGCTSLQTLDLSGWDTSNVTDMYYMFYNCTSLQTLDVSGFDTSNVTKMESMFYNCTSLQTLDVSGFDTSNVTNMSGIFSNCKVLQTLDVSGFDTSNVTNMSGIFSNCKVLQTLDLTGWDASKVTGIVYFSFNATIQNYVGGRTIDEVITNNISILNGLKVSGSYIISSSADRASLRALINGLADLTGETSKTLTLGSTLTAKLTEEDIAIATAKNWTIA